MATLASMIVNVLANTAGFAKGMKEVRTGIANVENAASHLQNALGLIGVGFSAYAIVGELRATADEIDNLAKVADRLGITTEALKGLEYGAGLAGVSSESLAGSLQFMTKQIGEAIHDGGKAKAVFQEMGLSLDELRGMAPEKQLMVLAGELNNMADEAERTRAALRLFGGDGAAMLNFLSEGEAGIKKYMAEAEKLGMTYSREEAAKVEAFNDAWEKLSKTLGGISKDITISIAPQGLEVLKGFQEAVEGMKLKTGVDNKSYIDREFPMTKRIMGFLSEGFTGQWEWQKSWTEANVKRDVEQLVKIRNFNDTTSGNAFTPAEIEAGRKRWAWTGTDEFKQASELRSGFGFLFGKGKSGTALGIESVKSGLKEFANAIDKAKAFGAKSLLSSYFTPTPPDGEFWKKRDTEQQLKGLQFISDKLGLGKGFRAVQRMIASIDSQAGAAGGGRFGINSPLIKGTMEAARLELAQQNKPQKQILDESRKHTTLLTKITEQLRLQVTGV